MDLQALVNDGFQRHQSGQLEEALRLYRTVLAVHPPIALVLSLAGDAATSSGDPATGAAQLRRALALEPRKSSFHQMLAFAEASSGRVAAAEKSYATAVECDPGNLSAMNDWANLIRARVPEKARALIRKCLLAEPANSAGLRLLAELTVPRDRGAGRNLLSQVTFLNPADDTAWRRLGFVKLADDEASAAARDLVRSLVLAPAHGGSYTRLANASANIRSSDDLLRDFKRGTLLDILSPETWLSFGNGLHGADRKDPAERCFQRALLLDPSDPTALGNLLVLRAETGAVRDEILGGYRKLRRIDPTRSETLVNLTKFLSEQGTYTLAIQAARAAMATAAMNHDIFIGLANGYRQSRRHASAERSLRWASAVYPEAGNVQSGLVMGHNYEAGVTAASLSRRHRDWAERMAPSEEPLAYEPDRSAGRKIHLGFLSPDMKRHPVGFFLLPVLKHLDRDRFRVTVYSDLAEDDYFTEELRRNAETWHDTGQVPDLELRQRIMEDRVDILFDLAGHSAGNRMRLFARRAAPLQMTWMGYVGTTGLRTMDYLVTDRFQTAPGTEVSYTEKWLVLPDDYICFYPSPTAPAVAPAPVLSNGYVTFGSFNNPAKLTDETLTLWSAVMAAVPDSRLLLSYRGFDDPGVQTGIREVMASNGIAPERIAFETNRYHEEFLGGYGEVDIALDTMPYSGGLTTCEALWMGVPVVTLVTQDHFAGRHSLSHLSNAGFAGWAVGSRQDFVDLSRALAAGPERLARIRQSLRAAVASSPLCDQVRYVRNVENKLAEVWSDFCSATAGERR